MEITRKDTDEHDDFVKYLTKIDSMDAAYVNTISEEIFRRQPFFLTVLLGYRLDTSHEELEEIMKMYFLIWECFRSNKNVQTKKVSKTYFEKIQSRHYAMLTYASGEIDQEAVRNMYSDDLKIIQSKSLLAAIYFRYTNRPILVTMDEERKGKILVGMKSFIECFEKI